MTRNSTVGVPPMPDPNLSLLTLPHNLIVWLAAHPVAWWAVAGFWAGWAARGRLTRYALGFGLGRRQ